MFIEIYIYIHGYIYENINFFIYLCHFWAELALEHAALHCNALGWIAFLGLG
jgi:hypothetical protein